MKLCGSSKVNQAVGALKSSSLIKYLSWLLPVSEFAISLLKHFLFDCLKNYWSI